MTFASSSWHGVFYEATDSLFLFFSFHQVHHTSARDPPTAFQQPQKHLPVPLLGTQ
jgi:hypothetical protein